MIEFFQCTGCVHDNSVKCGEFEFVETTVGGFFCKNHVPAAISSGEYVVLSGLPTGFNRIGAAGNHYIKQQSYIRMYDGDVESDAIWNTFNVPVWRMHKGGYFFVRTFMPRINVCVIDVFKGDKDDQFFKGAIDVTELSEKMD